MEQDASCTIYTDASGVHGRGATMGDAFIKGKSPMAKMREGVNWEELWVLKRSTEARGSQMSGKLVLAGLDNATATSCANYGAGWSPPLTMLACDIKELKVSSRCAFPVSATQ